MPYSQVLNLGNDLLVRPNRVDSTISALSAANSADGGKGARQAITKLIEDGGGFDLLNSNIRLRVAQSVQLMSPGTAAAKIQDICKTGCWGLARPQVGWTLCVAEVCGIGFCLVCFCGLVFVFAAGIYFFTFPSSSSWGHKGQKNTFLGPEQPWVSCAPSEGSFPPRHGEGEGEGSLNVLVWCAGLEKGCFKL
jgi:hypothetical protein